MKKRLLGIFGAIMMIAGAISLLFVTAYAANSVSYLDWNDTEKKMETKTATEYEVVTSATTIFEAGKTYVVTGNVTVSERIKLNGNGTEANTFYLILCDGAKLTAEKGINMAPYTGPDDVHLIYPNLIICGQTLGTGVLEATANESDQGGTTTYQPAIGCYALCGNVTINGGNVIAHGNDYAPGIGSSHQIVGTYEGDTVTVTVTPNTGYQLKANTLKATYENNGIQTLSISGSGPYTFEMPAYAVTVTAEFEKANTIADILPNDFPTSASAVSPANAWVYDADGYVVDAFIGVDAGVEKLMFSIDDEVGMKIPLDSNVSKNGNNYIYSNTRITMTFVMNSDVLSEITVYGSADWDGTYLPPALSNVAKIGDNEYATLQDAVNDVTTGDDFDTLVLLSDSSETVTVSRNVNFILDSSTFTFSGEIIGGTGFSVFYDDYHSAYYVSNYKVKAQASGNGTVKLKGTDADIETYWYAVDSGFTFKNDTVNNEIRFNFNGANGGSFVAVPNEGYELDKWTYTLNGNTYDIPANGVQIRGTNISGDITLTAVFKPVYTVKLPTAAGYSYVVKDAADTVVTGTTADGVNTYGGIAPGEKLKVFFTLDEGFEWLNSNFENPLIIEEIAANVTLTADDMPTAAQRLTLPDGNLPEHIEKITVTVDGVEISPTSGTSYMIEAGKTAVVTFIPSEGYAVKPESLSYTASATVTSWDNIAVAPEGYIILNNETIDIGYTFESGKTYYVAGLNTVGGGSFTVEKNAKFVYADENSGFKGDGSGEDIHRMYSMVGEAVEFFQVILDKYVVDIEYSTNGRVTVDEDVFSIHDYTEANETVTVTVIPDEGYVLKSLKYTTYNDGEEDKTVDITSTKSFIMPLAEVTITAEFAKTVSAPTANTGLVYDKTAKAGVTAESLNTAYTLTSGSMSETNAGNYTATFTLADGYAWADGSTDDKTVEWSIAKKEISISWNTTEFTYDGQNHHPTATTTGMVEGDSFNPSYIIAQGTEQFLSEYKNAGTYSVYADFRNDNYEITDGNNQQFTITKIAATITAVAGNKVYGEADPTLTATVSGVLDGDTLNYTVKRAEGENVAEYALTIELGSNPNYEITKVETAKFTITKKAATITAVAGTKVYGASDPALTATVTGTVGSDTLNYTVKRATGENVGEYALTIELGSNPNYEITKVETAKFTITKKAATITADAGTKVYGEEDPALTATVTGAVGTDILNYTVKRAAGENAGEYALTIELGSNPNYEITKVEKAKFIITKKEIAKPAVDTTSFVYTGNDQTYTIAANELYTVSGNVKKVAGEYDVTVALKDKANYKWADDGSEDLTYKFTIAKIAGTITVDTTQITVTYGDSIMLPKATSNFGTVTCDKTAADLVNAGTYTVTYTLTETADCFGATKTLTVVINKKEIEKPTADTTKFVYNVNDQTYMIAENALYTVSGNVKKDAGEYDVAVSLADQANYKWADGDSEDLTFTFTIAKAENAIRDLTIGNWKDTETGKAPTATADFGEIEYLYSKADVRDFSIETLPTEAGKYIVKAFVMGTDNYAAAMDEKEFTIYQTAVVPTENADKAQVISSEKGVDPNAVLVVSVLPTENEEDIKAIVETLNESGIEAKRKNIFGVYDAKLLINNLEVQPDGKITVRMQVPEDVREKEFKLYHIHIDAETGEVSVFEVEYTAMDEDGNITFETDKLSQFAFVANAPSSLWWLWVIIAVIVVGGASACVYFFLFRKKKKEKEQ